MRRNFILNIWIAGIIAIASLMTTHAWAFPMSHYTTSSKLSQGTWVKVKITESGIYQITDADARNWGFIGGAASLHVFGKGGAPISEKLTTNIPDDLPQVPVVRSAGKLVFYAQGPITWKAGNNGLTFVQQQHPYSNDAFYFITDDPNYSDVEPTRDNTPVQREAATTFIDRQFHELDLVNPGETGREYLGEDLINTPSYTFKFNLKDKVNGSNINVLATAGVIQTSTTGKGNFSFASNGTNLPIGENENVSYRSSKYKLYYDHIMPKKFTIDGEDLNFTAKFTNNGANYKMVRLNSITVNYERNLSIAGSALYFATPPSWTAGQSMEISNTTNNTIVWDVTVPHSPIAMNASPNDNKATFATPYSGMREFVAFEPNKSFSTPQLVDRVANQDIHALEVPDMIIITHRRYFNQAQRVAALHESVDSMRVLVLNQDEIFNEFSSGQPDMMAYRMVCKYFFDRGIDSTGHHLQHVLLMGNGSWDNKQITSEFKSIAYPALLTWQNEISSTENNAHCTDDCITVLGDNTSNWHTDNQEIGVGRFPVKSEEEARIAVDKLINYVTTPNYGSWRNRTVIMADDEEGATFMKQCENYITNAKENDGEDILFKRIYLDAYEAETVGSSRNYPGARDAFYTALKDGMLMWAYNGHSSANVMSSHNIVRRNDYLNNMYCNHLPLMMGTTCEQARYDALDISGGEYLFLNPNGGAIAVMSSNRQAFITDNATLGNQILAQIFKRDKDGNPMRLGDVMRHSKNATHLWNNECYLLLGDPAMRLALPRYKAKIEAINGKPVDSSDPANMPVFKARQSITFTGSIVDHAGKKVDNFNGTVTSNLFDCDQSVTTHGYGGGEEFTYQEHSNRIALSSDSVKNGEFSIKLTIPSEIMYSYDNFTPSLINLYAHDQLHNTDASGSSEDFYIYGYDETVVTDTIGPDIIYLGLNSENFKDGDDVNESPLVIATVSDAAGINMSDAGIGHSITLTLDGKTVYNDVNKFFTPQNSNDGSKGSISYLLKDLENGHHTLRLRVWDVYGNMGEKTISFNVVNGLKPEIYEVYTTNNPASTSTTFYVKHNRPDAKLNMGIQVYDIAGRMVWNTQQSGQSDMFKSFPVTWNLNDMAGNRVPRGIYVYRAIVSTDGVKEATKSKKLAVTSE